jgi:hypothetical protein
MQLCVTVTGDLPIKLYNTRVQNFSTDRSEKLESHILITFSFFPVPSSMQLIPQNSFAQVNKKSFDIADVSQENCDKNRTLPQIPLYYCTKTLLLTNSMTQSPS